MFIRAQLPQDHKIEHLSRIEAMEVTTFLVLVVGHGHVRQFDAPARQAWLAELHPSRTLAAPCRLWDSIVELVALHQAAQLQHCRQHVLTEAA